MSEQGNERMVPELSAIEARILGCLVEKQATTPESYPLTANAVVLACNQKTSREPVMELEPGEVEHALRALADKHMVRAVHGSRAQRYEHLFAQAFSVTAAQQALLALMMLRGPQTLAELHSRSERLATIAGTDEVRQILERLATRSPALVVALGRAPGQREDRYMHLLCGPVSATDYAASANEADATAPRRGGVEARLQALEVEVAALRRELDASRGQS